MSNEKISGVGVVIHGSIDPSVHKAATTDLPGAIRQGSSKVADELKLLSEQTKARLNSVFNDMDVYWGKTLDKMAQRISRGNFSASTEKTLQGIRQMADALGKIDMSFTAGKLLDLGSKLRLPEAVNQVKELHKEFTSFVSDYTKYQAWLGTFAKQVPRSDLSTPLTGTQSGFFANVHGEFNQKQMLSREQAYEDAYSKYYGSDVFVRNEKERKQYKSAALGGLTDMDLAAIQRRMGEADSEQAREIARLNAISERHRASIPPQDPGIRSRNEARVQAEVDRQNERMLATRDRQARRYILTGNAQVEPVGPGPEHVSREELEATQDDPAAGDRVITMPNRTGASRSSLVTRLNRTLSRGTSRMSSQASHQFRFASQNVGFGIDDALQQYQYGGPAAAVRAASNNATAIAGMLISNPVIAAAAVIAISAATAAIPVILNKFGITKALQNMSAMEKDQLRYAGTTFYEEQEAKAEASGRMTRGYQASLSTEQVWSNLSRSAGTGDLRSGLSSAMFSISSDMVKGKNLAREHAERMKKDMELQINANLGNETDKQAYEEHRKRVREIEYELEVLRASTVQSRGAVGAKEKLLKKSDEFQQANNMYGHMTQDLLAQGDLSIDEYKNRIQTRADRRKEFARKNILDPDQLRGVFFQIDQETANILNDPIQMQRDVLRSQYNAETRQAGYRRSYSGDTSLVGGLTFQYLETRRRNQLELDTGLINRDQFEERHFGQMGQFNRERSRAIQDEIEMAKPERNPLLRMATRLTRRMEDFALEQGKTPEEQRNLAQAILEGAQRDQQEALRPSGTRRFSVGRGMDVGSDEDIELQARMTGNFQWEKKTDNSQKTLEEILAEMKTLVEQLKLDGKELEGK